MSVSAPTVVDDGVMNTSGAFTSTRVPRNACLPQGMSNHTGKLQILLIDGISSGRCPPASRPVYLLCAWRQRGPLPSEPDTITQLRPQRCKLAAQEAQGLASRPKRCGQTANSRLIPHRQPAAAASGLVMHPSRFIGSKAHTPLRCHAVWFLFCSVMLWHGVMTMMVMIVQEERTKQRAGLAKVVQ